VLLCPRGDAAAARRRFDRARWTAQIDARGCGMNAWLQRFLGSARRRAAAAAESAADRAPAEPHAPRWAPWHPSIDVDVAFCRWVLGQPSPTDQGSEEDEAVLLASLHAAALTGDTAALVPRVPAVVPQLLRTLRDPEGPVSALARQVEHDPVLVAAVLKIANSPYYRPARPITSIEQALLVLGRDGLRQLLATIAFKPILNLQSGAFTRRGAPLVWDQSERCGVACHVLAPIVGASGFEAFLGALLQNVGAIVVLRMLDRSAPLRSEAYTDDFCRTLTAHARRLACEIGQRWSFPASVIGVAEQNVDSAPPGTALRELLQTADRLSKARVLFEAGCVSLEDLAIDDSPAVGRCFARLVKAPSA